MNYRLPLVCMTLLLSCFSVRSADFFKIDSVKFLKNEPNDGVAVWLSKVEGKETFYAFAPCLEVEVLTAENTRSDIIMANVSGGQPERSAYPSREAK